MLNRLSIVAMAALLASISIVSEPSWAAPEQNVSSARSVVETIIDRARNLDDQAKRADHERTIETLVDFRKLASDALGERSKQASAAQRKQIEELLRTIITRTVYPEAPKFFRDVKIDFTNEQTGAQGRVHVTSVVHKGEKRSTVEYWLAAENNSYRVVDLAIEGERWVENVRDQFDEIIGKHGVTGLISRMQKRANELKAPKSAKASKKKP